MKQEINEPGFQNPLAARYKDKIDEQLKVLEKLKSNLQYLANQKGTSKKLAGAIYFIMEDTGLNNILSKANPTTQQ